MKDRNRRDLDLERECLRLENLVDKQEQIIKQLEKQTATLQKQVNKVLSIEKDEDYIEFLSSKAETNDLIKKVKFLKQKWLCDKCGRGYLILKKFPYPGNQYKYSRRCSECPHSTRMKDYNGTVEGITEDMLKKITV